MYFGEDDNFFISTLITTSKQNATISLNLYFQLVCWENKTFSKKIHKMRLD